ncbi:SymE family type I addiction module toxin [Ferruginibacter sp.]
MATIENVPTHTPTRQLTICNKYFARQGVYNGSSHVVFPTINLCGKWLQDMGFEGGQVITIECRHRQLIIRTDGTRKYGNNSER